MQLWMQVQQCTQQVFYANVKRQLCTNVKWNNALMRRGELAKLCHPLHISILWQTGNTIVRYNGSVINGWILNVVIAEWITAFVIFLFSFIVMFSLVISTVVNDIFIFFFARLRGRKLPLVGEECSGYTKCHAQDNENNEMNYECSIEHATNWFAELQLSSLAKLPLVRWPTSTTRPSGVTLHGRDEARRARDKLAQTLANTMK